LQYSSKSLLTLALSSYETSPNVISSKLILASIPLSIFMPSYPLPVITGIRAFYVNSYIVFIFCNDPHTLADVVREKTKEYIRRYNDQYCLDADELERYSEILVPE
jgi:hypothetical protein